MENKRKRYSAEFKFKVALEAVKERQTMSELTTKFGVHSTGPADDVSIGS